MAKGIIVVDVPENCENCLFFDAHAMPLNDHTFCRILMRGMVQKGKKRPDWCPIQEIPERMKVCGRYPQPDRVVPSYKIGWNACIDEILKRGGEFNE